MLRVRRISISENRRRKALRRASNSEAGELVAPYGEFNSLAGELVAPCWEFNSATGEFVAPCREFNSPAGEIVAPHRESNSPCAEFDSRVATRDGMLGRLTGPPSMPPSPPSAITPEQFLQVLHDHMPEARDLDLRILRLDYGVVEVRLGHDDRRLRPGGTISGPTVFMLADLALYAMTMSLVGLEPLAVTTDMTVHFLRKPAPGALVCKARVLKGGKRLVVGEAEIMTEGSTDPVAHLIGTYSVPPRG